MFDESAVIYTYTRRQAVEEGEQVLLSEELGKAARQLYKWPVYMTNGVWQLVERAVANPLVGNSVDGVVWDILWMSRQCSVEMSESVSKFEVLIAGVGQDDASGGESVAFEMLVEAGPVDVDDPRPCLTIMLPRER